MKNHLAFLLVVASFACAHTQSNVRASEPEVDGRDGTDEAAAGEQRTKEEEDGFAAASGKCGDVTTQRLGNFFYGSDGTVTQRLGDFFYEADGAVTQRMGSFYFHSGGKPCDKDEK